MSQPKRHALLVSFPVFSHIMPTLRLAKKLSDHGIDVSLLLSAAMVKKAEQRQLIPKKYSQSIAFLPLNDQIREDMDMSPSPTLREHIHQVMAPFIQQFFLELLVVRKSEHVNDIQHNSAVDYDIRAVDFVMCDQFVTLPFRICQQRRIPCHMFVVTSALALFTTMTVDEDTATAKQKQFFAVKTAAPLDKSIGRQFAEINMHFMMRCNTAIQYASTIVVDTFRDLEMGALSMIAEDHRTAGAAVYAIGPLLTEDEEEGDAPPNVHLMVKRWLEARSPRTTIYVASGARITPKNDETKQIALALLSLRCPFIWSLQQEEFLHLPEELRSIADSEIDPSADHVIQSWIPQQTILSDVSTKVFITHCGWNSVLESIYSGVPMVFWPQVGEQSITADWLAREGLGKRITGTGSVPGKVISAREITDALRAVCGWGDSEEEEDLYCDTARKWSTAAKEALADGGSSEKEFGELISPLLHRES